MGALALRESYKGTELGKVAIKAVIGKVVSAFEESNCPGCWGICDTRNIPMYKYLEKLFFKKVDMIRYIGKSVYVYERSF